MDLPWMILPVFLVCAEAQNVTDVKVELGQNVILNCSQDISDIYWYLEIHSRLRGCIVRSFSATDSRPMYCSPEFKAKYSLVANRLVVRDVTAEDCRLHFCAKKRHNVIHFVDTFRLVSDVPTTSPTSSSETNSAQMTHSWRNLMEPLVFISSIINAVLNIVLAICCLGLCLKKKKKKKKKDLSPFTCENTETLVTVQYQEIQFYRVPPSAQTDIHSQKGSGTSLRGRVRK